MSKQTIYRKLVAAGMTPQGACGLMGNMQAESELLANNAQNGMTTMSDEMYVAMTDSGAYTEFCTDKIGFGLCQWTAKSRKTNLLNYAKRTGRSIGNEDMQVEFCVMEFQTDYASLWRTLCSITSVYNAASKVCTGYECPQTNNITTRAKYAQEFYDELFGSEQSTAVITENKGGASMGYDVKKVIAIAEEEVGYLEKKSNLLLDNKTLNKGANNYTKYSRDLDNIAGFYNGKKQGFAYCDQFVDWCFVKAYGVDAALYLLCQPIKSAGAGCQYSAQYYKNKSQFYTSNPQVGDQIFFGSASSCNHTGLVYAVDATTVYTIEGNVSGANGEGVYKKSYPLGSGAIYGYGRPNYGGSTMTTTTATTAQETAKTVTVSVASTASVASVSCSVTLPELSLNCAGAAVEALQFLLIKHGYKCGTSGADGDFGANTKSALMKFQSNSGLVADGICGKATWEKILKG